MIKKFILGFITMMTVGLWYTGYTAYKSIVSAFKDLGWTWDEE